MSESSIVRTTAKEELAPMSKDTTTMLSSLRFPRTVLTIAAALLALSAAGISVAGAPVLPAGAHSASSSTDLGGLQLPTLSLDEAPTE
jgi:hypothetical protein